MPYSKTANQISCVIVSLKGASTRPCNPTPGHATGQGSPAPLRPKNPTPVHAAKNVPDRPGTELFRPATLVKYQLTNIDCLLIFRVLSHVTIGILKLDYNFFSFNLRIWTTSLSSGTFAFSRTRTLTTSCYSEHSLPSVRSHVAFSHHFLSIPNVSYP